ncbi:TPA: type IV teichoic acid flippase TacF [Streptococcus pneumoniae]
MKSIKLNALSYMGIRVLNIIFPILTGTYVARVLDRTDYGYFNSVDTILSFFLPFATYGVYNYGLRAISNVKDNKKDLNRTFSSLFYLCIACTILTTAVYILAYPLLFTDNPIVKKVYLVMGIQLIAQIFSIEWVNEALENYSFLFYKTAFIRILMLVSIFLFVKNEHDIVVYTLVMSLSTLINYLISYFWIKRDIKLVKIHLSDFKPLFLPLTAMLVFANANMLFTFLDRLFLVKTGIDVNVSYYTIAQRIVTVIAGVVTGAIGVSVPRLSYYLGKGDKEAYVSLVNRGSRIFNFFIIPLSFGLMVLGPNAILLYGSEKYIGGGILTSLFAFRTIILALDTILGSQILFTNGYEKRITVYTVFAGLLNLGLNSLLFFNHIVAPEYYLLTTMLSETSLLVFYIIFIHRKQLIHLGHIFSYTVRYSLFSLSFVGIYFLINFVYPVDMVINLPFLINTGLIVLLSAISYISLLVFTKDSIFYEFLNHVLALKNKFKKS